MKIEITRDYKMFRQVVSNREVDRAHVRKLAKSISRKRKQQAAGPGENVSW